MAWSGTYSERIVKKLDDLAGAKYTPQYDTQIQSTANQIANYGPYKSNYEKNITGLTGQIENYGPYKSNYQSQIDSLMGQLGNWNYDPEADTSYQAYKRQYTDLGNKAMRNTLGQVSARTGGLASSYATSAAQQSYNDYMTQLANIIPQLEAQAYNRASNSLNMYNQADTRDYGRYRDTLQDLYNRQGMYQGLDATDYSRWADALQNLYSQNGMYLNMDQNELARYQAGQSDMYNQLKAMQDYNDWEYDMWLADQAALAAAGGGGGGGGRGGSGGGSSTRPQTAAETAASNTAVAGGAVASTAATLAALANKNQSATSNSIVTAGPAIAQALYETEKKKPSWRGVTDRVQ